MDEKLLNAVQEEGFSFIWRIENYHVCCRKGVMDYKSPVFDLDDNCHEEWSFRLYPERDSNSNHDKIFIELKRTYNCKKLRNLSLDISIYDVNGSFKKAHSEKLWYKVDTNMTKFDLILNESRLETYPNNTSLILKFGIRDLRGDLKTVQCYARTIRNAQRIVYPFTFEGLDKIDEGAKIEKENVILSAGPLFTINLSASKETCDGGNIEIKMKVIAPKIRTFCTYEISLIDANRKIAYSVKDKGAFGVKPNFVWTIPFIPLKTVLDNEKLYLPKGVLHLRCEFLVSTSDPYYSEIEQTECGQRYSPLQFRVPIDRKEETVSLTDNMKQFYGEGKFTDLTIATPSKEFRVHKAILCARSRVFFAMFDRDMKENQTGIVKIEDVADDAISRMLRFMYTDSIGGNLDFEQAYNLFFAADKYEIVVLKEQCSDIMKGKLTVANVCDALLLADMHLDPGLKSAAHSFILEHSGTIMESEEWEKFMEQNPRLTTKIMHTMLKRVKKY